MFKVETMDVPERAILRVFGSTAFAFAALWIISSFVI
jgi:hypothetical protein